MGKTRLSLVPVLTCIFLNCQTILTTNTESRQNSSNMRNNDDNNQATGNVRIDSRVEENFMIFNWTNSQSDASYRIAYKTHILACDDLSEFTWNDSTENLKKVITTPHMNVTLQLRMSDKNDVIGKRSTTTPGKEPETKVTKMECGVRNITVSLDSDCTKYNGDNLKVQLTLKVVNEELRVEPRVKNITVKNSKASILSKNLDLLAFTNYSITATPANDVGVATNDSLINRCFFMSRSKEPGPVKNLKVTAPYPNTLHVRWSAPDDNPPKGELEKYQVTWSYESTDAGKKQTQLNGNVTSWDICDLSSNTSYKIKVEAKNKNISTYGNASEVTVKTTSEENLKIEIRLTRTADKETLNLKWTLTPNCKFSYYRISLEDKNTTINETNTNITNIKFGNLTAGKEYTVKLSTCSELDKCGKIDSFKVWTRPMQPRVEGTIDILDATDTTITIKLPILKNPPGFQWILVKKEGGTEERDDVLKNKAEKMVRKEKGNNRNRLRRSIHTDRDEQLCIMKNVKVDKKKEETVKLGNDASEENCRLESNNKYVMVIVTETRAGNYSEYYTYGLKRFRTKPRRGEIAVMGIIGGICGAAVFFIIIVALIMVKCNKSRKEVMVNDINPVIMEGDSGNADNEILLKDIPNGRILTEDNKKNLKEEQKKYAVEDVYANVRHDVSRKDLEMYLPRAVFAAETTMEFNSVPLYMPDKKASESFIPENVSKNRYRNEISYDDTRVKLPLYNNIPHSDYINANYVQDPLGRTAFIATQGPKDKGADTIGAFWRMIWHTKCTMILMVANLVEGGKVKVSQYWPETDPLIKEGIKVTLTSVRIVMDFAVRTFIVSFKGMEREVTQYQYTAWPDHGVPQTAYGLSQMIKTVIRDYAQGPGGPITIHCSAGIGRTGTVLLTLFLLRQLESFNVVNIRKALHTLREGRGRLVENKEQYVFVHKLMHDILFGMKTTFTCDFFVKMNDLLSSKTADGTLILQKEFEKIKDLPKDLTFKNGSDPICAYLNRNQDILPADSRMMFVQIFGKGKDAQYLNVIRINGFDRKDAYIAGEHPQAHSLPKIWRLVYEHQIPVWLLLQELPPNDPSFPDVMRDFPSMNNMKLKILQSRQFENFTEYTVTLTVEEMGSTESHKCTVLMLKGWSHAAKLPSSPASLLGCIEKAESLQSPQTPLLFTCCDGVTACGVMAALLLAVSRAKLTQEVDLYRSALNVQYDRPQFITDVMQYQFLYKAMGIFLNLNNHYGNFN